MIIWKTQADPPSNNKREGVCMYYETNTRTGSLPTRTPENLVI